MNPRTIVGLGLGALFLYWIVQAPVGAARVIRSLFEWAVSMLALIADRVVAFLNALM